MYSSMEIRVRIYIIQLNYNFLFTFFSLSHSLEIFNVVPAPLKVRIIHCQMSKFGLQG